MMNLSCFSRPTARCGAFFSGTAAVLLSLCLLISHVFAGEQCLKLGVVPYKSPRTLVELYGPVAAVLEKALGEKIRVVTASGYPEYLERIYAHRYDIIVLGSTFYFKAHDRAGYRPVARGIPSFHCGLIVRKDSDIVTMDQLRGRKMAAVNSMDRGGFELQRRALLAYGIDMERELEIHYRGSHDSVVYAVLNGQDDVGAVRLDAFRKPVFSQIEKYIRVLYTSPEVPQFPFAVRPDMDPARAEAIGEALVGIDPEKPGMASLLEKLNITGFERVTTEDLERLRKKRILEEKRANFR